jgi:GTP-binding nuclear protein Ran
MRVREFNLFFIGDSEVGKSTFLKRYDARFQKEYTGTNELEFYPLVFFSTQGPIQFNIFDTVGEDTDDFQTTSSLHKSYFKEAHCVIVMFDVTRQETFDSFQNWCRTIVDVCDNENLPIVLVGNKCDLEHERRVFDSDVQGRLRTAEYEMGYCDVSAKSGLNYCEPFIYLARKLLEDVQLHLIDEPSTAFKTGVAPSSTSVTMKISPLSLSETSVTPVIIIADMSNGSDSFYMGFYAS